MSNVTETMVVDYVRDLMSFTESKDAAVAKIRNLRKKAKGLGINLSAVDKALDMAGKTEGELADELNSIVQVAKFLSVPLYSTMDLFAQPEPTEENMVLKAAREGSMAGKLGKNESTNPHDPSSPPGQAWLSAYRTQQSKLMEGIRDLKDKHAFEEKERIKAEELAAKKAAERQAAEDVHKPKGKGGKSAGPTAH